MKKTSYIMVRLLAASCPMSWASAVVACAPVQYLTAVASPQDAELRWSWCLEVLQSVVVPPKAFHKQRGQIMLPMEHQPRPTLGESNPGYLPGRPLPWPSLPLP